MIVATNISNLERLLFAGLVDLPWWGYILVALGLTHMTIIAVTLFLHRHQTHRALDLHPSISHFFRMWLWLTTGMVTKQWVAVHRKHHAKVESEDDPHSPQRLGLNRVLWTGVLLYVDASKDQALVERYGYGTPNDWMERTIYSKYSVLGLTIVGLLDVVLFGFLPGTLIFMTQIAWIPFWAAGVINGVGHYWGYRNWRTNDASSNMVPWGVVIGGEELHNNHHAFPTSAKFSTRWYEFDIGWMYVRLLQVLGLATVRRLALGPKFGAPRATPDLAMLNAIIRSRYDVMAHYERMFNRVLTEEVLALSSSREHGDESLKNAKHLLLRDEAGLTHAERPRVAALLRDSHSLSTLYGMRAQLTALWARSLMPRAALVSQLQLWCDSAEASGVSPLVKFSRHLRSYS